MCFCCIGPKRGALFVLHASVLIVIYSLVREIVHLCVDENKVFDWTTGFSMCAPIFDLVTIIFGIRGISLNKASYLVPVLSSKFIYFFQTCIILAIIPVACYTYGFEEAVREFRHRFIAMGSNEPMPFYWEVILVIFKSLLIFPMEEILYSRYDTVAIVYIVYFIIVTIFQGYCVATLMYCYYSLRAKSRDETPKRFCIARRQTSESTTYLLIPEGKTPPYHPESGKPYPLVNDQTYEEIVSTAETIETIPISIN